LAKKSLVWSNLYAHLVKRWHRVEQNLSPDAGMMSTEGGMNLLGRDGIQESSPVWQWFVVVQREEQEILGSESFGTHHIKRRHIVDLKQCNKTTFNCRYRIAKTAVERRQRHTARLLLSSNMSLFRSWHKSPKFRVTLTHNISNGDLLVNWILATYQHEDVGCLVLDCVWEATS
jgi:hypothetical protein